jgi:hypothetical protein
MHSSLGSTRTTRAICFKEDSLNKHISLLHCTVLFTFDREVYGRR